MGFYTKFLWVSLETNSMSSWACSSARKSGSVAEWSKCSLNCFRITYCQRHPPRIASHSCSEKKHEVAEMLTYPTVRNSRPMQFTFHQFSAKKKKKRRNEVALCNEISRHKWLETTLISQIKWRDTMLKAFNYLLVNTDSLKVNNWLKEKFLFSFLPLLKYLIPTSARILTRS